MLWLISASLLLLYGVAFGAAAAKWYEASRPRDVTLTRENSGVDWTPRFRVGGPRGPRGTVGWAGYKDRVNWKKDGF